MLMIGTGLFDCTKTEPERIVMRMLDAMGQ